MSRRKPTSSKKRAVIIRLPNIKPEVATQGRKYGYSFQNWPVNTFGKRSLGRVKEPPSIGLYIVREEIWYSYPQDLYIAQGSTQCPNYRHQSVRISPICDIGKFPHGAFNNPYIRNQLVIDRSITRRKVGGTCAYQHFLSIICINIG